MPIYRVSANTYAVHNFHGGTRSQSTGGASNTAGYGWSTQNRFVNWRLVFRFARSTRFPDPATLTVPNNGLVNVTLGALTLSSTGTVKIVGTLSKTFDALTLASAGKVLIVGSLSKTLAALTLSSAGQVIVKGDLARTLAALSSNSAGQVIVRGDLAKTLGALAIGANGTVRISGLLSRTLAVLILSSQGTVTSGGAINNAALTKTLDAVILASQAWHNPKAGEGELVVLIYYKVPLRVRSKTLNSVSAKQNILVS